MIDLQDRQDAMESQKKYKKSGQVSETQVEYKTDLLVKDNRKNRLDNDGTGKSTKSKKQKKMQRMIVKWLVIGCQYFIEIKLLEGKMIEDKYE